MAVAGGGGRRRRWRSPASVRDGLLDVAILSCVVVGGLRCTSKEAASHSASTQPAPPAAATPVPEPVSRVGAPDSADRAPSGDLASALSVLRGYYDAIDKRDYAAAFAAWGSTGPPGHPSLSDFSRGYATTDSVRLTLGAPGPIEGAAGSRYVEVPVRIRAFDRGHEIVYAGSYTMRRTPVPGAPASDKRWHLYRATLASDP